MSDVLRAREPQGRILYRRLPQNLMGKRQLRTGYVAVAHNRLPQHPMLRRLRGKKSLRDNSTYYIDIKRQRIAYILTVNDDGLTIGWDTCGHCHHHLMVCRCKTFTIPKRVGSLESSGYGH